MVPTVASRPSRRAAAAALAVGLSACFPAVHRAAPDDPGLRAALAAIEATPVEAAAGAYRAGWARAPIRVPRGAPLGGFGHRRGAPHQGERDTVAVRAFAVAAGDLAALIFTADVLLLTPEVAAEVRRRLRDALPPGRIHFTASHTHSGPGGHAEGAVWALALGAFSEESREALVTAHVQAARGALARLAPASLGFARTRMRGLCASRVELGGPVDEDLWVLHLEQPGGARAALWSLGCHPVTLRADNRLVSGDYPAATAAAIEGAELEVLGFAAGGVGSAEPVEALASPERFAAKVLPGLRGTLRAARAAASAGGSLASAHVRTPPPEVHYELAPGLAVWSPPVAHAIGLRALEVGALQLGAWLLLTVPAEPSGELTARWRAEARRAGLELAVLPFGGAYAGYLVAPRVRDLPPSRRGPLHAYETRTVSFLGPRGDRVVLELGAALARRVRAALQALDGPRAAAAGPRPRGGSVSR
jgi:neutral ceramidase